MPEKSTMEFIRRDKYVIASSTYRLKSISIEKVKDYLNESKDFVKNANKILILDEPTAGVDVELRRSLWKYITKLNKEGTTIFLTTHYLEEAEKLCDRIGVINHGKIIALDKKTSLINKLSNKCIIITLKKPLTIIPKDLEKYKFRLKNKKVLHFREEYDKLDTILKSIYKNNLMKLLS